MGAGVNDDARQPNDADEHMSDEELVVLAKSDPEIFGQLYERYAGPIEGFIRSRVDGNYALAQDLTSQVFTKAFAALPRYTTGPFRGWLYQIARNAIIDDHRRRRPVTPIDGAGELPSPDRSLDDHVVAEDARHNLHDALRQLKPNLQEVVKLRLHGLSNPEIGERLGMSEEAVKSAQYRAFNKLRTHLRGRS
jgi:RNA polymerase sigma-70 factor (ECF subfamily)